MDGVGVGVGVVGSMSDHEKVEMSSSNYSLRMVMGSYDFVIRLMGFAFTLVAAMVAGLNHETQLVPVTLFTGMPPLQVSATAKWQYLSSSVFFVVSNAIACSYSAASLILSLRARATSGKFCGGTTTTTTALVISDLFMVALLFSANGAAAAVGLIGLHGNSHVQWHKVCNIFKSYCRNGATSIAISMIGSFAFLCLVIFAVLNLHKRSR